MVETGAKGEVLLFYFYQISMKELTEVEAHNLCLKGIIAFQQAESSLLRAAGVLYMIRESKAYETEYGSWWAYVEEVKQHSAGTISKLIQVWEKYIVEFKMDVQEVEKLGWAKAYKALKLRNPESKEQAVAVFQELELTAESDSNSVLKDPNCKCEDCFEITFRQCRKCDKRTRVKSAE